MRRNRELPGELGGSFTVSEALRAGVTQKRLRGSDLTSPFHAVRNRGIELLDPRADAYTRRRVESVQRARDYAQRMREREFFSHETAAQIWGAPLPSTLHHEPNESEACPSATPNSTPHVSAFRGSAMPRTKGVIGHRVDPELTRVVTYDGLRVTSPASTWAMLGHLELYDIVAVGDYFARVWREEGYYRVNAGTPPLASIENLGDAMHAGRRVGIRSLRQALPLIRADSWSRTETWTRLTITQGGLPEPVLNRDYYDDYGIHLACVDLSYPEYAIAIEYQGQHHGAQYARDIERIEELRAAGWIVIQVTSTLLFENPVELVRRVRDALIKRNWRG